MKFRALALLYLSMMVGQSMGAVAEDKFAIKSELTQTQERIQKLENELIVQRQIMQLNAEASDKRLADFGALATMQGSQTTWVGNLVAIASAAITIIVAIAGSLAYLNVAKQAKAEAKRYFDETSDELQETVDSLKQEVAAARTGIASHVDEIADKANEAREKIAAAEEIFKKTDNDNTKRVQVDGQSAARTIVKNANEQLKEKPESSFSSNDFYIRGASLFASKNYSSSLDYFDDALSHSNGLPNEQVARYMIAKAAALESLDRLDEAIALLDQVVIGYSHDQTDNVQIQVATALLNKGVILAELKKYPEANSQFNLVDESYSSAGSSQMRLTVAQALLNRGIATMHAGNHLASIALYDMVQARYAMDQDFSFESIKIRSLICKAEAHGHLKQYDEELKIFENAINLYSGNTSPGIVMQVCRAKNGLGYVKILLAKKNWGDANRRNLLLQQAIVVLTELGTTNDVETLAAVIGNIGYAHFLQHRLEESATHTSECLRIGGAKSFEAQYADTLILRIEPEDTEYQTMLTRLWRDMAPDQAEQMP